MGNPFRNTYTLILSELEKSLLSIAEKDIDGLITSIVKTKRIFSVGAGRMGLMLKTFSMRLSHLGFDSWVVGLVNCPPISSEDLLLVASSSGETATVREVVKKACGLGAEIVAITARPESSIAKLASQIVYLKAPSTIETTRGNALVSEQPMKTLFEQSLFILLESMVLLLMKATKQSAGDMAKRHANME